MAKENKEVKKKSTTKSSIKKDSSNTSIKKKSVEKKGVSTKNTKQLTIDEVKIEPVVDDKKSEKKEIKSTGTGKKVKTSDILLIVGLAIVVVIGLFVMKGEKAKPAYTLPLELKGDAGLHLLSYAEYQEKIDNDEAFVVVLSRESCGHCANFLPVAKKWAEDKKYPMYYIDTDTFSESDWSSFEKSNSFLKKQSGNWGTPTTVVLVGSEAVDYIEGETTTDKLDELYGKYFKLD